MKKFKIIIFTILFCCLFVLSANAQKVWEKSADQWSKDDIELIMNNSPWAVSQELRLRNQGRVTALPEQEI